MEPHRIIGFANFAEIRAFIGPLIAVENGRMPASLASLPSQSGKLSGIERSHRFSADIARGGEFSQAVERGFGCVGAEDQQSIVRAKHPVLGFNADPGLLGRFVEIERA
jgi:hypothetical protein